MPNVDGRYDWAEIVQLMYQRRWADATLLRAMIDTRDRYNGDLVVPLPDVEGEPEMTPPMPRVVADVIDNLTMRATSVRPQISVPAMNPGSSRSVEYADTRRRALYATWNDSKLPRILMRRAYRHLIGYGTCAITVMPDFTRHAKATVELRDPLGAYPELRVAEDLHQIRNVGFIYGRSASWLTHNYPESEEFLVRAHQWDTLWDVIEWIDEQDVVLGILGPRSPVTSVAQQPQREPFGGMELRRYPNRAGLVPVAIPRRVTLNRVISQIANMTGVADLMARLNALDVLAAEKAIWPDMVLFGKDGRTPRLVSGAWKDGRTGEVNILIDGEPKLLQSSPGPLTDQVINRLDRAFAISTGNTPMMNGENDHGLRTGRALDTMGGFSIDPRVMEAQDIMCEALAWVNSSIMATEKGYAPGYKFAFFSGFPTDPALVEWVPSKHFETLDNVVTYPFPGTDLSQSTVTATQLVSSGMISKKSGRVAHPLIPDPDREEVLVLTERLEDAVVAGFLEQVSQGAVPLVDAAAVLKGVRANEDVVLAIEAAQEAAQKRQAAAAQPASEPGGLPPNSQPGLSLPGAGVESPAAVAAQQTMTGAPGDLGPVQVPPPSVAQQNLRRLLKAVQTQ